MRVIVIIVLTASMVCVTHAADSKQKSLLDPANIFDLILQCKLEADGKTDLLKDIATHTQKHERLRKQHAGGRKTITTCIPKYALQYTFEECPTDLLKKCTMERLLYYVKNDIYFPHLTWAWIENNNNTKLLECTITLDPEELKKKITGLEMQLNKTF